MDMQMKEKLHTQWSLEAAQLDVALAGSGKQGAYDSQGVDCPFVFEHHGRFYMMHVGFDGIGYQTALAVSDDLLHWEYEAVILPRLLESDRWDHIGAAGSWILLESNNIYEVPRLRKFDGRYWMIYHAYPNQGYEAGGAIMGLAWTEDETLRRWNRLEEPIFTYAGQADWEKSGLYKCCFFEHDGQFWMFYNAKGESKWPWKEETGLAHSKDMIHWERYADKPIMACKENTFYNWFYSDPCIRYDGERWLNFGFGFDLVHAQGLLAFSDDLYHWDTLEEPLIPHGKPGELNEIHAHKSFVVINNGNYYHYFCACRPWREGDSTAVEVFDDQVEFRCIAAAVRPFYKGEK